MLANVLQFRATRSLALLAVTALGACNSATEGAAALCSKPEGVLEPATISVRAGESVTFALPASVDTQGRQLQWVVSPAGIVAKNAIPSARTLSTLGVSAGRAMVRVTDLNSAMGCRDVWGAALLVE